jgi:hypothetical protein
MNDLTPIPYAKPISVTVTPVSSDHATAETLPAGVAPPTLVRSRTEGFAVASAICGFTAIVPLVSQVIGLAFGMISLSRIRRSRRAGIELAGTRWALAGITSSGFALFCWIAIFVAMGMLSDSLANSASSLSTLLEQSP